MIMDKGFVQMPLARYDELILDNKYMMEELDKSVPLKEYNKLEELLDSIVKIETDWGNEPRLKIDLSKLAARINDKFNQSEFADKYTMIDLSEHVETIWGAFKEIQQVDEEDQA